MIAKHQIPNLLTAGRVLATPLVLLLMVLDTPVIWTLVIFILASITDFLDGYLARKWQCSSAFGAFADPIADKLLVTTILIQFAAAGTAFLFPVTLIILREIYISGVREYLAKHGANLPVSKAGKWKTALQMLAITVTLLSLVVQDTLLAQIGLAGIWLAALLSVTSAISYTKTALRP